MRSNSNVPSSPSDFTTRRPQQVVVQGQPVGDVRTNGNAADSRQESVVAADNARPGVHSAPVVATGYGYVVAPQAHQHLGGGDAVGKKDHHQHGDCYYEKTKEQRNDVVYASLETANELWALPPGWTVVRHQTDGRLYYHETSTGRTSWVHPMVADHQSNVNTGNGIMMERAGDGAGDFVVSNGKRRSLLDTPANAARRPDSHQCCSCVSLVLCLPMGICAMIHSYRVDQAWKAGDYGDAVNHSRQAHNYACWGSVIGISILLIWWFRNHDYDFPDYNFDR